MLAELQRLGYVEGQNLVVVRRTGSGRRAGYQDLARELVLLHVIVKRSPQTPSRLNLARRRMTRSASKGGAMAHRKTGNFSACMERTLGADPELNAAFQRAQQPGGA